MQPCIDVSSAQDASSTVFQIFLILLTHDLWLNCTELKGRKQSNPTQTNEDCTNSALFKWHENRCLWVKWVSESWVMSQWVRSEKIKISVETIKLSITFTVFCLLASLLPAHSRPISDLKSQPGLFVSSIPGPAATITCMPQKIAFSDTLQGPFKPSVNPYYKSFHTRSEVLPQGCSF